MKFKDYRDQIDEEFNLDLFESNIFKEAVFNIRDLEKVSKLLAKIASKKIGTKFEYAWTDMFTKKDGKRGYGIRYLSTDGYQIRFNNYIKASKDNKLNQFMVEGVDFWETGDGLTNPSLTLTWNSDINIVQLTSQLFKAIKSGKVPEITDLDFQKDLSKTTEAMKSKSEREDFAKANNIAVSWTKSDRALKDKIDRTDSADLTKKYEEWMKIKKNVSEVTEFSLKADANQEKLVSNSREFYADPNFVFEDMKTAALTVAKGLWRSLIVAGMGGIGKTFGIKQVLTQTLGSYGEGPSGNWAFYEGLKTTGFGLYKLLLLNKNKLIVFDDSDSIWGDSDIINMMKIVTSDSGDRTISWQSNAVAPVALMTKEEREQYEEDYIEELMVDPNTKMKAPSSFNFKGTMINISNMSANKFDAAIKSRAIFIDLYLAERDVIRRMYTIKKMQGVDDKIIRMFLTALVPEAEDALDGKGRYGGEVKYITPEIARKHKTLNMRSLDICEALYKSGAPDWERMAGLYG